MLASLPSPFSRLVFLASLRDSYTGRYLHEGWSTVANTQEVHSTLERVHWQAFEETLELPLPELFLRLLEHFRSLVGSEQKVAKLWLDVEPFREMLPAGCPLFKRDFFISQMRTALGVFAQPPESRALLEQCALRPRRPDPISPPHPETRNTPPQPATWDGE